MSSVRRRRKASATDTRSLTAAVGLMLSKPSAGPESGPVEKNDESADAMATALARDEAASGGGHPWPGNGACEARMRISGPRC